VVDSGRRTKADVRDPGVTRVAGNYHGLLEDNDADPRDWAYAWRSELNRGGFHAVDFLMDEIVDAGKCVGCASCVTICPVDVFDYEDEKPTDTRNDACVHCVLCADVCPVLRPADADLRELIDLRPPVIDEGFGGYSYGLYARTTDAGILERAQDGGVVSAMLINELEAGRLGGAILGDVTPENRQVGRHRLATNRDDVLDCAASRYTYSPNTLALQEAMEKDVRPLAVVGVPCQVDGVRYQQHSGVRLAMADWYRDNITLVIGLFCSEAFTHESLIKLGEMVDVDPAAIENINIKGKVVVRLDDGEIRTASLKSYRDFARPACLYCLDYSAEHSDLACGGIGIDGWTYVLVRTEAGHAALERTIADGWLETRPLEDEPRGDMLLRRLSASKKRNRPLPAQMPDYEQRLSEGWLDPKTYYTSGPGAPPPEEGGDE
jgi:coenzyme F420 hydrogenase subunit beta